MLPPGRNKVLGWTKQGGGPDSAVGLVFATCALEHGGGARNLVTEFLAITMFPEVLLFSRLSSPAFPLGLSFPVNFPPTGGGVQGHVF